MPSLSLGELRSVLALIGCAAESALQHTVGVGSSSSPVMLTTAVFAERLGDVTPETVERWCRDGRFRFARSWGKAGWRVPEFYLYAETPPASQREWFERLSADEDRALPTTTVAAGESQNSQGSIGKDASMDGAASSPAHTLQAFDPESVFDFRGSRGGADGRKTASGCRSGAPTKKSARR